MKHIILFIFLFIINQLVFAIEHLTIQLDAIESGQWQLGKVILDIQMVPRQQLTLQVQMGDLMIPGFKKPLKSLRFTCQKVHYTIQQVTCAEGRLKVTDQFFDKPEIKIAFTYSFQSARFTLNIKQFAFAKGLIALKMESTPKNWQATLTIQHLQIAEVLERLAHVITLPPLPQFSGLLTTTLKLSGSVTNPQIKISGELSEFNFSNATSTQAAEGMTMQFAFDIRRRAETWQIHSALTLQQGEIYIEPIYLAATKDHLLNITTDLLVTTEQWHFQNFSYRHGTLLQFQGNGILQLRPQFKIINLFIQLPPTELAVFYQHYLHSWLSQSAFGKLELSGTLSGKLDWQQEQIHLLTELDRVTLEDQQHRFGLTACSGIIQWHNQATHLDSQIHWSNAYFASQINLGKSQITARLTGSQFELLSPWRQPILDGAIQIEKLLIKNIGQAEPQFALKGEIIPISMQAISKALKLPPLSGKISGQIPLTHYDNHQLEMDGELVIHLFDGQVTIHALQIANLFKQPLLSADIQVDKINLKTLTNITEFGEIQGQLSGWIRELRLVHWQPVSFDAYFTTPADNTLPRKISQKAIKNLSNIGGGNIANILSQGILQMFEDFSYQFIGIGCRLQQGTCELRGLEPVSGGYYLVKGKGLPRIDIIGYNQKINWNDLLTRLKAVTRAGQPIVK